MGVLRFSASSGSDAMWRLPRHPDWKYEMVKGDALLSSRPRPLLFVRSTSVAVPVVTPSGVEIRTIDARHDRVEMIELTRDVWVEEDPYRSLEDPETLLRAQIERSLEEPSLGVVAVDAGGICAVVLVGTDDAGAAAGGFAGGAAGDSAGGGAGDSAGGARVTARAHPCSCGSPCAARRVSEGSPPPCCASSWKHFPPAV